MSHQKNPKELHTIAQRKTTTKQDIKVELSASDQIAQNLKTIASLNQKKGESFIALGTEYKHSNIFANATLELGKRSGPGLLLAAVFGYDAYSLGVSGNYQVTKQAVENLEAVASFRTLDLDVSATGKIVPDEKTKREAQVASLSVFHLVNVDTTFGAEAVYNLTNKQADLSVVAQHNLTSDLTTKAKFNSAGQISLAYIQKVNKNVRVVFSTQVDVQSFTSSAKVAPLFGFCLNATF